MRNIPVNAGGKIVRVGDVAEVTRGYIDPATFVIHHEGEPALILGVVMVGISTALPWAKR